MTTPILPDLPPQLANQLDVYSKITREAEFAWIQYNINMNAAAAGGSGSGSVTSVAAAVPTGFAVSGSPITSSGTLAITYSGYIPLTSLGSGSASASNYLRGDGTWATPSGGGTVTSVSGTAPVASSGGATPAISMAAASAGVDGYMTGTYATKLDGIATGATANAGTVTSVAASVPTGFSVSGSPLTSSGTLAIAYSGYIPVASLGSGTTSSSTYLRGDGTWATVPGGGASGGTPALTLGTANTAGTAGTFIREDDTILVFDATAPSTQAFGDSAVVGTAAVAARRDHKHAMMSGVTSVSGTAPVASSGGATPAISMAAASSGVNGYMTGTYATKLDGIATGANAYTLPTSSTTVLGGVKVDGTSITISSGVISAASSGGTVTAVSGTAPVVSSGGTTPAISMSPASGGVNGYMTSTYAAKLDGIAPGATNNPNTGTVTHTTGTLTANQAMIGNGSADAAVYPNLTLNSSPVNFGGGNGWGMMNINQPFVTWTPPALTGGGNQSYVFANFPSVGLSSRSGKSTSDLWNTYVNHSLAIAISTSAMANSHYQFNYNYGIIPAGLPAITNIPSGTYNNGAKMSGGLPVDPNYQEMGGVSAQLFVGTAGNYIESSAWQVHDYVSSPASAVAAPMTASIAVVDKNATSNIYTSSGFSAGSVGSQQTTYAPTAAFVAFGGWQYGLDLSQGTYAQFAIKLPNLASIATDATTLYVNCPTGVAAFNVSSYGMSIASRFGCNGNGAQGKVTVNAASTDLASVVALCNQLRSALVANGICV